MCPDGDGEHGSCHPTPFSTTTTARTEKLPPLVTAFLESDARFVDAAVETKLAVLDCMISACFHSQAHRWEGGR